MATNVTLKSPAWLSQLAPSAPHNCYLMEHAEFTAELAKDERINEDLKVTVEVTARSAASRLQAADIIGLYTKPGGSGQDLIVNGI